MFSSIKVISGTAEVIGAWEVGGAILGAASIRRGMSGLAESDPPAPARSSTPYTDSGGGVCTPPAPTDGRDAMGRFTSGGGGFGLKAQSAGLDHYANKAGRAVITTSVRATLSNGGSDQRYYDAMKPDGTYEGIEVKSGVAVRTPAQRQFDAAVDSSNGYATARLNG